MSKSFTTTTICVVVFILSLNCVQLEARKKVNTRIVGGFVTRIERVPYLVKLFINGQFACGGSLTARSFVVTAAHCVKGIRPSSVKVVGGSSTLRQGGSRRAVTTIFTSSDFNTDTMNMDVAVLKLNRPMTGNGTETIPLCSTRWRPGLKVKVSGWGYTRNNAQQPANQVHSVYVPLIAKSICQRKYGIDTALSRSMICAALPGRKDSCLGDSGGPLVFNNQLCGIVSWGLACASKQYPGVYTSINVVKFFIVKNMRK